MTLNYNCLIDEIKEDIAEFGGDTLCYIFWDKNKTAVNYDFIDLEHPLDKLDLKDYTVEIVTFGKVLGIFETQGN